MRKFFGLEMENYQGDLTDIVRASRGVLAKSDAPVSSWDFPSDPVNNHLTSSSIDDGCREDIFGDPFCNMRDPLLHELNVAGSSYFSGSNATDMLSSSVDDNAVSFYGANSSNILPQKVFNEEMNGSPCNILSRIQISPNNPTKLPVSPCNSSAMTVAASSPRDFTPSAVVSTDMINANSSKSCLIENTGQVQISSPRNLGIKRRKSQAKKVVCIPAPAAATSRPSGEVVPSDLWAWRKYGQKPIKGSPYPRGYYRCSSSKGCSARKQVERSRTDPNMLVITYTSEHNHPWPTQRNALAGSTRSQPPKNNAASSKSTSPSSQTQKTTNTKEEQKESSNDTLSPTIVASGSTTNASVKEEIDDTEKQLEMDENDQFGEGFSYRPTLLDSNQSEDFFSDLGEIDPDHLDLLFPQGFGTGEEEKETKNLDPFSIFDWSGDSNNTSFGEAKGGL
ncbi:hypothetical protein K2173_000283 [Erythroxylum novogranatense]|uniref:WRKY domain-containing protein n=1 Tax=Erythroxylum novogranatense TaxID=1862640 RepID=A0AAV8SVV5_9ROSI|nr:hypothetical protein K2173_000283 [Erythroxylum novogranatense]